MRPLTRSSNRTRTRVGRSRLFFASLAAPLLVAAFLATGAAPSSAAVSEDTSVSSSRDILLPPAGAHLGAFVDGWETTPYANVTSFEASIGAELTIDHHFYGWASRFPTSWDAWDVANGRIPMASWSATRLGAITSGKYDALVRARARAIRDFGHPIFLRFAAEMNGDWLPWSGAENGRDPSRYVAAWRRVHRIFSQEGATNAVWVWCPNSDDVPAARWNHFSRYYPGDAYVDWVGIDGYNWGTTRVWSQWRSFRSIFARVYAAYAGRKPIMVAETSSAEEGGSKGTWIRNSLHEMKTRFPEMRALVWFEVNKENDWRASSSSSSLTAYRALASDPHFG